MTFKPPHTGWNGDQLGYQDLIIDPDDTREDLYCLTMPQSKALIALIDRYRFLTRWYSTEDEVDRSIIEQFTNDTQRRLMMPCGSDNVIVLSQFTPNGHYQESTDGGETYHDAPGKDPRNNVPIPPPFLPEGTEEAECTYADAIVNQFINSWINATGEGEDLATAIEGMLAFLAGVFGAFGGVVAAIVLSIAASIVATTVIAWKAAFNSDVWDRFRCNLHDNQQADGSFTQADVDNIYDRIAVDETGIVMISLQQMVAALGWQGLTITARSGVGSPTADCTCDDCNTGDMTEWDIYDLGIIEEETLTVTNIVIDGEFNAGDSKYYIILIMDETTDSVDVTFELTGGALADCRLGWTLTGETPTDIVLGVHNSGFGSSLGASSKAGINGLLFRSDVAFQMTVNSNCPE